jgi:serine/threonine-protein kinase
VSHPNACRVYDIGEHDGQHFLAMEYIDGEDLASLLRRVGRLPEEKGVEIARQLCLALAAVHEQSLLHRDLKPQNVMLDGRGRVRLTDFGLAAAAEDVSGTEVRSGTPAYQAPEQLRGESVSVQSGVFALGLVLYEVFTGKPAFRARTRAELVVAYESGTLNKPSSHVSGLNPAIERVLLSCLEKDAKDRPRSAFEVVAGLPGGDPLAAALAAGETPSPQMVADAPVEGRLSLATGLALLAAVIISVGPIAVLADRTMFFRQVTLNRPPEVMAQQAQDLLERFCHTDPPADRFSSYQYDTDYLRHVRNTDPSPGRWDGLKSRQPDPVVFFYRQSPRPLIAYPSQDYRPPSAVVALNPPPLVPGIAGAELDGRGRLLSLYVIPPEHDTTPPAPAPDWRRLFEAAGLDFAEFLAADPEWNSPVAADGRAAWTGAYPGRPDLPLRIEAGAYRGRPVFFKLIGEAWVKPAQNAVSSPNTVAVLFFAGIMFVGGALAARNLWLGRGDWRGAGRLAIAFLVVEMIASLRIGNLSVHQDSLFAFFCWLGYWMCWAASICLWYLAMEPTVRRRWPWRVVGWGRVLDGRFRDPLIGRDLLVGLAVGTLCFLFAQVMVIAAAWPGPPPAPLMALPDVPGSVGPSVAWGLLVQVVGLAIAYPLMQLSLAFLLYLLLRKPWLSWSAYVLLPTILFVTGEITAPFMLVSALVQSLSMALLMSRVGLLALASYMFVINLLPLVPLTTDLSLWYAGHGVMTALVVIGLAMYGFVVSVGTKQLALRGFFGDE